MHKIACSLLVGWLVLAYASDLSAQDVTSQYRHWTTRDGTKSSVRLKVIQATPKQVRLQREDNEKIVTMLLSRLSAEDRQFVESLQQPASDSRGSVGSQDWPQWRGPARDGKSTATGLLDQWPSGGPELLWKVSGLGEGYSTPAVAGEAIYVLGTKGDDEMLFALSVSDGSQIWASRMCAKTGAGGFPGPKGTPTVDGDRLYAIGSDGTLVCVNRTSGQAIWSKNMKRDMGGRHGPWHYAESPLVDGNKVICTPGGTGSTVVALQKASGAPVWSSAVAQLTSADYAKAGYASVIAATIAGQKQYVAFVHGGVLGIAAETGQPLWHYDSPANETANCSTPVVQSDSVFAASGYGTGGGRAQIARRGNSWNVSESYFVRKMQNHHGGFVLHDGHIYGTNDSVLMCIDWETGEVRWQDRCVGKGSVVFADGHLYVRGEGGEVALVQANPGSYVEKGRFSQPDRSGKSAWAHPVVANGRLFLHDEERLLAYSVR